MALPGDVNLMARAITINIGSPKAKIIMLKAMSKMRFKGIWRTLHFLKYSVFLTSEVKYNLIGKWIVKISISFKVKYARSNFLGSLF